MAICLALSAGSSTGEDVVPALVFTPKQLHFFEKEVAPILTANCLKCHGGSAEIKGGLKLTSRENVLRGGDSGPAAEPGEPNASLLIEAVRYESFEMPPTGQLSPAQVEILATWVKEELPWPPGHELKPAEKAAGPPPVNEETKSHWAFQPVRRVDVPDAGDDAWIKSPIDAFVLAKLDAERLAPNPPADKAAWLRRAHYDLTGLPPSPEEVRAFLADDSDDAREKVIDRLLDSPHYGEHWGRHWLDLVRYAETNSYERDDAKPFVWRYRDYVIRAFNEDKPYDRFVREQLAGDELETVTAESLTATGYYRLGIWDDEPADPKLALYDGFDDYVRTTGEVFLGLTLGCCRCHDHKLDPLPQADYYRFMAFFSNVRHYGVRGHDTVLAASVRTTPVAGSLSPRERAEIESQLASNERRLQSLERELDKLDEAYRTKLPPGVRDDFQFEENKASILRERIGELLSQEQFDAYAELTARREELREFKAPETIEVLCVKEHGASPPVSHVLLRGNPHVPGDEVQPGFPQVLSPPDPDINAPPGGDSSGRRRALADWIAAADNPLAARVFVNRVWQYHFGRGLVRSPNNFGLTGDSPTHPELLDWLASELVAGGWRLKRLHKLIMLSSTYAMSSRPREEALAADPENDCLWRYDMRRLTAEEIRDSILAASGELNTEKMYGPSIYPQIPPAVLAGQSRPGAGWETSPPEERGRRSVYIHVKRSLLVPIIESHDAADTDATCPVRFSTTQPTQALGMLNGDFLQRQAAALAAHLKEQCGDDVRGQVRAALWRVTQRPPTDQEIDRGARLIESLQQDDGASQEEALRWFCLVALNLNEMMYLD